MASEDVKLLGAWASPFVLRVVWALKLKGVAFDYVEQDLFHKSPLLLELNPVYKKVPVLVHGGKPLPESAVILEYIDETWTQQPVLLPQDPYERSRARFWAKFGDEKCVPAILGVFFGKGEEAKEKAAEEAKENLKTLESGLQGKRFFGGETINFADISVGWIGYWAKVVEEITGITFMEPSFAGWFNEFIELPVIRECIPPWEKLVERNKDRYKMLTASSST